MFRSVARTTIQAARGPRGPVGAALRCASTAPKRTNHFVPLALLGAAALGLTYYNMGNVSKPPQASVDPVQPEFGNEVNVLFVLGGPGSGKGTQCANLVRDYGFVHLSAGDLLRAEQDKPGSEYGDLIRHYIKEGLIVPQEVTIGLLQNAIGEAYAKGARNFLVDGFPRKMDQALSFQNKVARGKAVVYFECPEEVMLKRLLQRGKTSGRADDNVESIRKRFTTFVETSMPVVDYFEDQGRVIKVACSDPVDVVYANVVAQLKDRKVI